MYFYIITHWCVVKASVLVNGRTTTIAAHMAAMEPRNEEQWAPLHLNCASTPACDSSSECTQLHTDCILVNTEATEEVIYYSIPLHWIMSSIRVTESDRRHG